MDPMFAEGSVALLPQFIARLTQSVADHTIVLDSSWQVLGMYIDRELNNIKNIGFAFSTFTPAQAFLPVFELLGKAGESNVTAGSEEGRKLMKEVFHHAMLACRKASTRSKELAPISQQLMPNWGTFDEPLKLLTYEHTRNKYPTKEKHHLRRRTIKGLRSGLNQIGAVFLQRLYWYSYGAEIMDCFINDDIQINDNFDHFLKDPLTATLWEGYVGEKLYPLITTPADQPISHGRHGNVALMHNVLLSNWSEEERSQLSESLVLQMSLLARVVLNYNRVAHLFNHGVVSKEAEDLPVLTAIKRAFSLPNSEATVLSAPTGDIVFIEHELHTVDETYPLDMSRFDGTEDKVPMPQKPYRAVGYLGEYVTGNLCRDRMSLSIGFIVESDFGFDLDTLGDGAVSTTGKLRHASSYFGRGVPSQENEDGSVDTNFVWLPREFGIIDHHFFGHDSAFILVHMSVVQQLDTLLACKRFARQLRNLVPSEFQDLVDVYGSIDRDQHPTVQLLFMHELLDPGYTNSFWSAIISVSEEV